MTVCYIHVPGDLAHEAMTHNYLTSVLAHPAGCDHRNLIICQGREPSDYFKTLFGLIPNTDFFVHDDSGWDIGGYIAAADYLKEGVMLCLGGSSTVRREGWLSRMREAWNRHGPGFYGSLTSNQVRPHFNTTGFWCTPQMLLSYPHRVVTREDRYEFEHGKGALWWRLNRQGIPTKLVTWDGEYDWPEFRKPQNISCRGDQSNCLTYFRISYNYDHYCRHDIGSKANLEYLTDHHIVDQEFTYPNWVLSNQEQT